MNPDSTPTPLVLEEAAPQGQLLYNADPDCDHEIIGGNFGSGIKCAKCPGWFCY